MPTIANGYGNYVHICPFQSSLFVSIVCVSCWMLEYFILDVIVIVIVIVIVLVYLRVSGFLGIPVLL